MKFSNEKAEKLITFALVVFIIGLYFLSIWTIGNIVNMDKVDNELVLTKSTPGTIVSFQEVVINHENNLSTVEYKVEYQYIIDEQVYTKVSNYSDENRNSDIWKNLKVYYNPKEPWTCKLNIEMSNLKFVMSFCGFVALILSVFSISLVVYIKGFKKVLFTVFCSSLDRLLLEG